MTDLELMITGAVVTFIAVSGAYVAIRHRANDAPVDSYKSPERNRHGYDPAPSSHQLNGSSHHERAHAQHN